MIKNAKWVQTPTVDPIKKQHMGMQNEHTGNRYYNVRYRKQNWEHQVMTYFLLGEALEVVHP
jgi:hypothetical protein